MSNLLQNLHSCDLKWFWLAAVWCSLDVYRFGGVKFGIWLTGKYLLLFYRVQRKQSRKNVLIVKDYKTTFDFRCEITERGLNWTKKVENGWKKIVQPAFGCAQHPKAGRNTQQLWLICWIPFHIQLGIFPLNNFLHIFRKKNLRWQVKNWLNQEKMKKIQVCEHLMILTVFGATKNSQLKLKRKHD